MLRANNKLLPAALVAAFLIGIAAGGLQLMSATQDPAEPALVQDDYYESLPSVEYGGMRERDNDRKAGAVLPGGGLVEVGVHDFAGTAIWYPALSSAVALHHFLLEEAGEGDAPQIRVFERGVDLSVHLRGDSGPEHWDLLQESVRRALHGVSDDNDHGVRNVLLPTRILPAGDDDDPPFVEIAFSELVSSREEPGESDFIYLAREVPRAPDRVILERMSVPLRGDDVKRLGHLFEYLLTQRWDPDQGRGWPVPEETALPEMTFSPESGEIVAEFDLAWWKGDSTWSQIALDCVRAAAGNIPEIAYLELRAPDAEPHRTTPLRAPVNRLSDQMPEFDADVSVKLHAVGDVMLDRGVQTVIDERGFDHPFKHAAPVFRAGDLTFINLESPLAESGEPLPGKGIWFRADPRNAAALHRAGVDVVNFANNHSLDYGRPAFTETFEHLRQWGILAFGGGQDEDEAHLPLFWEGRGVRMAFLGYTEFADIFWDWNHRETFAAGEDLPGVAPLDRSRMLDDVKQYRDDADALLVSVHWGDEYVPHPPGGHSALGEELIAAGADAVLGHHPHVLQCVNVVDGRPILHSLGNFIFDQTALRRTESVIARLYWTFDPEDESRLRPAEMQMLPYRITDGQPAPAGGAEIESIFDYLKEISRQWGTGLHRHDDILRLDLHE